MTVDEQLKAIDDQLIDIKQQLITHVHGYAGANSPGGPALAVKADEDTVSDLLLTGVSSKNMTKVMRNPSVTMTGDTVRAATFKGSLDGNAASADRLSKPFDITLSGDVAGVVSVDGSRGVTISTKLASNGVSPGEYGPIGNTILAIGDSFAVPEVTVNSSGVVTSISNKTITIPGNTGVAGTTGASQYGDPSQKVYTVGSPNQGRGETTYTDAAVYTLNHRLFSNNSEVVNLNDKQWLTNKIYEGFKLGAACERGVDASTNGIAGSQDLVTSDALSRHVHPYADADANGDALRVKLNVPTARAPIVVGNPDSTLSIDTNVCVDAGGLTANSITALKSLSIPGGTLWVDQSANVIDVAEYDSGAGSTTADRVTSTMTRPNGSAYTVDELLILDDVRLQSVEGKVSDLEVEFNDVDAKISACSKTASSAASSATLNSVDLASVKVDVAGLDERVTTVETEVSTALTSVSGAIATATNAAAAATQFATRLSEVSTTVSTLESTVANVDSTPAFIAMQSKISSLQASITSMTTGDAALATRVQTLETNIATLSSTVATLKADVTAVKPLTAVDKAMFDLLPGATYVYTMADKFATGVTTYDKTFTLLVLDVDAGPTHGLYVEANSSIASTGRNETTYTVVNLAPTQRSFTLTVR